MGNVCQQVLKPLGSYTRLFTVSRSSALPPECRDQFDFYNGKKCTHSTLLSFHFLYSFLNCVYFIITNLQVHTKAQTASRNRRRDSMLGLLRWVHFLHNDPTDRVPACVGVSLVVRVPTTAGAHIEGYIYRTLRDPWAVSLNRGCTNDVPRTATVNCSVNWHGTLCTVKCKELSAVSGGSSNPRVPLIDNPEVRISVLFDKWALLVEIKKKTI